jgi:hypothetical protein
MNLNNLLNAVRGRDGYSAKLFIEDVASRLASRVQLTSAR